MTILVWTLLFLSLALLIHLGQYLALESQFRNISIIRNIFNLWLSPFILICWQVVFINNVGIAMLLALSQKLMEKLEEVPEKDVDVWVKNCLKSFNALAKQISLFCLILMPLL